jgi:hypothetical protein
LLLVASLLPFASPAAAFQGHPLVALPSSTVLFVVGEELAKGTDGDLLTGSATDHQTHDRLRERFQMSVVVDTSFQASDLNGIDAVVLAASTSASNFRPFLLKAAVPVVALKASSWTALGLAPFEDGITPLQDVSSIEIRDIDHPVVNELGETLSPFLDDASAAVGQGWTPESTPADGPLVLADGPEGAAVFVYEPGTVLDFPIVDDTDVAPACRVGLPSNRGTLFSTEGLDLLERAVSWSTTAACSPDRAGLPMTPSADASMCLVDPADESRVLTDGEFVDVGDTGRPNLSSLWVRALVHDAEVDVLFVGGRFDRAYDSTDRDLETGLLGEGVARDGLFACDLATGTVTDFDVPLVVDSLGVTDSGSLRTDRIRALALHGEHLYVGGRFTIDEAAEVPESFPLRSSGVVNLLRVDRLTGEIDFEWSADVRGGVSAIVTHGDHLYVSGGIHTAAVDGELRPVSRLIRLDIETAQVDPTFTPMVIPTATQADGSLFASVSALAIDGDTLFAGGSFERIEADPTTSHWRTYLQTVVAQPATPWPDDEPVGEVRNSVAAFDLTGPEPVLSGFAPSIGDNNLAGGDVTAQIRDLVPDGRGSVFICGDWWLTNPEPGLVWIPYDADQAPAPSPDEAIDDEPAENPVPVDEPVEEVGLQAAPANDPPVDDREADLPAPEPEPEPEDDAGAADEAEVPEEPLGPEAFEEAAAPDAAAPEDAPDEPTPDPNDPNEVGWEGQRSLHQPRPNQHNVGKFDTLTGASALSPDGGVWGATTDGGIQACDYDGSSDTLIIGGHHESIGAFDPAFVDDPDVERYPDGHRPLQKVNALDGASGRVLAWDPDLNSVRGVDAVLVIPGAGAGDARIVVGGAFTSSDRMPREGLALYTQHSPDPVIIERRVAGGFQPFGDD